ncbi:DUF4349 domain-containing protein [Sphingomonas sp. HITSZ_GF]|uniref:DUF4349 domain-containing protein n=1 Tax=Sphingomonas sp. HITSZ_GF TaxID=3037247 RepID=UPI00240D41E1|nr:DUF4349 domain-containing protein [Sphingomonas sp. HITSZ_GF]MDG2533131.1 DUF4349 domain-containing protein [Sphingomonas sp. HITSZ_GF]
MAKPNRWILLGSGSLAAILVAGACVMLFTSAPLLIHKQAETLNSYDIAEPPPALASVASPAPAVEPGPGEAMATADAIAVNVPQIAYSYTLGYRLPAGRIAAAQQAHVDLCNKLGPRCQLVAMQRASDDDGVTQASLKLRIASSLAQKVSADFTRTVGAAGGRAVDTEISAEDVSKDMVDTAARLRQREILVSRLTEMLRGRQGKVGELVEAERSVAQAQEELDQAKGWLGELKGRVAYSNFAISYTPTTAPVAAPTQQGFFGQIGDAVLQSAATVIAALRSLIVLLIFLLPWAVLAIPALLLLRPALRRWRRAGLEPVNEDV